MANRIIITVTLFGENSSFGSRRIFRDAVNTALEQEQLGTYVGGGTMVTDDPHYNLEYEVTDESQGLPLICNTLRQLGVSTLTELSVGGTTRYNVYDDTWTNLGPRPRSASQPKMDLSAANTPSVSVGEAFDLYKRMAEDLKKKRDSNSGA